VSDAKKRERLDRIYDALEASLEGTSRDELREMIRARGADPDQVVRDVRAKFASIVKEHRQTKLREAREGHAAAIRLNEGRRSRIPADPGRRREIYLQVAHTHSQFTLQHRDLEALPEDELLQILEQMEALGLLPDEDES
jgi:hypothetical protein